MKATLLGSTLIDACAELEPQKALQFAPSFPVGDPRNLEPVVFSMRDWFNARLPLLRRPWVGFDYSKQFWQDEVTERIDLTLTFPDFRLNQHARMQNSYRLSLNEWPAVGIWNSRHVLYDNAQRTGTYRYETSTAECNTLRDALERVLETSSRGKTLDG